MLPAPLDTPLLALLAGSNWPRLFDRKVLRLGSDYARQRAVTRLDLDTDASGLQIRAQVLDGAAAPYTCRISLRPGARGPLEIGMSCSCDDGTLCAHCAAALLAAVERNEDPVPLLLEDPVLAPSETPSAAQYTPTPVLRLRTERFNARGRRAIEPRIGVARLSFDYGGHRLRPDGRAWTMLTLDDGRQQRIERVRALEGDIEDRLRGFNLVPADLVLGLYLDDEDMARFAAGDYVLEHGEGRPGSPRHLGNVLPRLAAAGFVLEFDEGFPIELLPDQRQSDAPQPAERQDVVHAIDHARATALGAELVQVDPLRIGPGELAHGGCWYSVPGPRHQRRSSGTTKSLYGSFSSTASGAPL